jgi:hypothetical protein
MQAQGYWVIGNWTLFQHTGDQTYRDVALSCSGEILRRQRADGAWDYPNPEWRGRVATVEGVWGSLGLLASYRNNGDDRFLAGALKWHNFLVEQVGFQKEGDQLAVNYFAHRKGSRVPNNSTNALRLLAELAEVTADQRFMAQCDGMVAFMEKVQLPSGEIPYTVDGVQNGKGCAHFQCFQYNAFQCLGLLEYAKLSQNERALPIIRNILEFLRGGVGTDGHVRYECDNHYRRVVYHAAALALAFHRAKSLGIDGYEGLAERTFSYVLERQTPDGNFCFYSEGDYRILRDRRSYPRYLSMIMVHLLSACAPPDAELAAQHVRELNR